MEKGDKVQYIGEDCGSLLKYNRYEVENVSIDDDKISVLDYDGNIVSKPMVYFKFESGAGMKTSDLANGMVVELRNGWICLVHNHTLLNEYQLELYLYNEDFYSYDRESETFVEKAYDIMKVYWSGARCLKDLLKISVWQRKFELLWERKEDRYQEMAAKNVVKKPRSMKIGDKVRALVSNYNITKDKVRALANNYDITKGKVYEVKDIYPNNKYIVVIDNKERNVLSLKNNFELLKEENNENNERIE